MTFRSYPPLTGKRLGTISLTRFFNKFNLGNSGFAAWGAMR